MYDLEFLPVALRDLTEIARDISQQMQNPAAAEALAEELISATEAVIECPYAAPLCFPVRPVKHEYRKLPVRKHLIFYWVNEYEKKITVAKTIYARRDYGDILD